jgi:Fic family protein
MDGIYPCTLNQAIVTKMMEIAELVGKVEGMALAKPSPRLRHSNRVRSIQGSVGIEGNTCSVVQVEAIAAGRAVAVSEREQLEVRNALAAYAMLPSFDPLSLDSLLSAHAQLMGGGLMLGPGRLRKGAVEVYITETETRAMPQPDSVPGFMDQLFGYLHESDDSLLLKSVRFHFGFVNIHPFADGNGRTARLWQTRLMMDYHPIFEFLDVESMVFAHRPEYYARIREAQDTADSAGFAEFMLMQIHASLSRLWGADWAVANTVKERLRLAREHFQSTTFSRKDYLQLFKTMSAVTASRDLKYGVDTAQLVRTGDRRTAVYRFAPS